MVVWVHDTNATMQVLTARCMQKPAYEKKKIPVSAVTIPILA